MCFDCYIIDEDVKRTGSKLLFLTFSCSDMNLCKMQKAVLNFVRYDSSKFLLSLLKITGPLYSSGFG